LIFWESNTPKSQKTSKTPKENTKNVKNAKKEHEITYKSATKLCFVECGPSLCKQQRQDARWQWQCQRVLGQGGIGAGCVCVAVVEWQ
jgi:hypothetical protein